MKPRFEVIEENNELLITPSGRLDIYTASDFEEDVKKAIKCYRMRNLTIDFKKITYLSSGGLRTILEIQKYMGTIGTMQLKNVSEEIVKIFKMTGFDKIVTIAQSD